jgi:hypothetical protein
LFSKNVRNWLERPYTLVPVHHGGMATSATMARQMSMASKVLVRIGPQ